MLKLLMINRMKEETEGRIRCKGAGHKEKIKRKGSRSRGFKVLRGKD
jgi:hypothetical protein